MKTKIGNFTVVRGILRATALLMLILSAMASADGDFRINEYDGCNGCDPAETVNVTAVLLGDANELASADGGDNTAAFDPEQGCAPAIPEQNIPASCNCAWTNCNGFHQACASMGHTNVTCTVGLTRDGFPISLGCGCQ